MQKYKQGRFALVVFLVVSMLFVYGSVPNVNAASLDSAKDTISDSEPSASGVSHTIIFNAGRDLTVGTVITVAFNASINITSATTTCPSDSTAGNSGQNITCTVVSTLSSTTDYTIAITDAVNPGTVGSYDVTISHNQAGGAESSQMLIYIIDDVQVTASVDASLTFAVAGVATTTTINGDTTTGSTSPAIINFGTLAVNSEQRMGQTLMVSTNAQAGFSVTVQQDNNLQSAAGADIDSFATTSPTTWASPAGTLTDESTYGHMGVASDDTNLSAPFSNGFYQGLNGTSPLELLSHDGPADGTTQDSGRADIMYNIEITDLQEAGDYSNTLTYICTPTY